ncbi:MAG: DNA-directed RNA polymerase specialized sigma24 family protein [Planctomycetota bacterium]|jgi:DNA-directed RNA polymerase specialized sigma24 family protein
MVIATGMFDDWRFGGDSGKDLRIAVRAALTKLASIDPSCAALIKLHVFDGATLEECAAKLGISRRVVARRLAWGRAWLVNEPGLEGGGEAEPSF